MKKTLGCLLLALAVAACSSGQGQPTRNPPAAEPPAPESGGEDLSSGRGPGPVAAPPDGGIYDFEACVKDCVRRNQMQAKPIEQIEAACQGECASEKKE